MFNLWSYGRVLSLRVSLVPSMVRLGFFDRGVLPYKNIHTCSAHFFGIDGDARERG